MKKLIFTLLLLPLGGSLFAQSRLSNPTNGSWEYPNLSIEIYEDKIITGFTETNPSTGKISPAFKITDLYGTWLSSFTLNFNEDMYLMDFAIHPGNGNIVLTGMTVNTDLVSPHKMYVAETNFAGMLLQSFLHYHPNTEFGRIPHQVIFSMDKEQVVIVGTQINGGQLTPDNFESISKSGFILGLKATSLSTVLFSRVLNSTSETYDSDMLESVTDMGSGYFVTGSANYGFKKQALLTAGISHSGALMYSDIHNISGKRVSGASVFFNSDLNRVYLLCNDEQRRQFRVAYFEPATGIALSDFYHYNLMGMPADIAFNGFRLQKSHNNHCVVAGYMCKMASSPTYMVPFEIALNHDLNTVANAKLFQSENYNPLKGYFAEDGMHTYIHTPDMFVVHKNTDKGYLVNQNVVWKSYDLDISNLFLTGMPCEENLSYLKEQKADNPVTKPMFSAAGSWVAYFPFTPIERVKEQILQCAATSTSISTETSWHLAPNPVSDLLTLHGEAAVQHITITDSKGQRFETIVPETNRGEIHIPVAHLPAGMYLLLVTDSNGNTHTLRFAKV